MLWVATDGALGGDRSGWVVIIYQGSSLCPHGRGFSPRQARCWSRGWVSSWPGWPTRARPGPGLRSGPAQNQSANPYLAQRRIARTKRYQLTHCVSERPSMKRSAPPNRGVAPHTP
jgi:hypothetical protein